MITDHFLIKKTFDSEHFQNYSEPMVPQNNLPPTIESVAIDSRDAFIVLQIILQIENREGWEMANGDLSDEDVVSTFMVVGTDR